MGTDVMERPLPRGQYWCGVKSEDVDKVWPAVEDLIERLVAQGDGEYTAEDMRTFCKSTAPEAGQLWIFGAQGSQEDGVPSTIDIVVITNFEHLPQIKIMNLYGLVGEDLKKYYHFFHEVLVPFAKQNGAAYVQTFCRKGLERTLKDWNKKFSVMRFYL